MKLVSLIGDDAFLLFEIPWVEYQELKHNDILGVPRYFSRNPQGGLFIWPLPMNSCKVYRLEDQGYIA